MSQASITRIDGIVDNTSDIRYSFFTPSTVKFVVMSICTLGAYEIYWFYKNWSVIKNIGKECSPLLRALFAPLSAYHCFWHIRQSKIKNKVELKFPILFLSIAYFVLTIALWLPDPFGFISFLTFVPIIFANRVALAVNQAQKFQDFIINNKFSKWNWLAII